MDRGSRRNRSGRAFLLGTLEAVGAVLAMSPAACGDSIPAAQMSFRVWTPRTFDEGTIISHLAVGDTDGDGDRDVVFAAGGRLVSLRGDGAGNLGQAVAAGRGEPSFMVLGDVNGDGRADLVATASDRGNLRVQLATGDGAFADPVLYGASNVPVVSLALADMDGDQRLDIVTLATAFQQGRADENTLGVLRNRGNGTFADAVTLGLAEPVMGLVVADFDGDKSPDAAGIETVTGQVVVMRNDGMGVMQAPVPIAQGGTASIGMTAGDIDGNGLPDLVVLNNSASNIGSLLNRGDGAFADLQPASSPAGIATILRAADFDGDGRDEIVGFSGWGSMLLWESGPSALAVVESYTTGGFAQAVQTADMDGDGDVDVVVANTTSDGGSVAVLVNDGSGHFEASRVETESFGTASIVVVDLDRDGRAEVLASTSDSNGLGWQTVLGSPNGERRLTTRSRFETTNPIYAPPAVGDLNGDNLSDIVLSDEAIPALRVALGRGDGSFATPVLVPADSSARVSLGHLNGDNHLDLVLAPTNVPGSVGVRMGDGRGSFGALWTTTIGQSVPTGLALADLDGDRRLDIVASVQDAAFFGTIGVLINDGTGKFPTNLSLPISETSANGLAVGDFDRSGTVDVFASTAEESGKAFLLFGQPGGGTFGKRAVAFAGMPVAVVASDLNRDHATDLIVTLPSRGGVELLMNDGEGGFTERQFLPLGVGTIDVRTGDVDGDGNVDIVVQTDVGIVVVWNDG